MANSLLPVQRPLARYSAANFLEPTKPSPLCRNLHQHHSAITRYVIRPPASYLLHAVVQGAHRPMKPQPTAKALSLLLLASGLVAAPLGCKSKTPAAAPAPITDANTGPDPADANSAPVPAGSSAPAQYNSAPNGSPGYSSAPNARTSSQPSGQVLGERQYAQNQPPNGEQYPETAGQPLSQYPNGGYQDQSYPEDRFLLRCRPAGSLRR